MPAGTQRSSELYLPGACEQNCTVCDCRMRPTPADHVARELAQGGARLILRGGTADRRRVDAMARQGREAGFVEIALRTSALAITSPEDARLLARAGVDVAVVPLFSQAAPVHDRIANRPNALVRTLVGMRALADAGLGLEIESPLLPTKLQNLTELVELAHRAVPTLRGARFYLPPFVQPAPLAPPSWTEGSPALANALARAKALGLKTGLKRADLVPLCALADHPEHHAAFRFHPKKAEPAASGAKFAKACESCVVRGQCPGVAESYLAAHGEAGLRPFSKRPEAMYEQRTTPGRRWDEAQRKAARESRMLVLRPTVNCNQDCTFCSANETSNNVWTDRAAMIRQIARAGRKGVEWLSFSGGDPTLSKDLVAYIRTAKRVGIKDIEIVTNGVLLDSEPKVRQLVDAGLTRAFVSLHAHTEELSRHLTQKVGDFERTARAIGLLVDAGVQVALNHVITQRNYRHLVSYVEFIHARYGGRVDVSFAFVTPQYKALENIDLVPRLSDVWPHLRLALHRAVELGQTFVVGARQGIPPCFLKEFEGFSDIFMRASELLGEDAPQKMRGPRCDECAYSDFCPGVWRPYVARYGLGELVPVTRVGRFRSMVAQPRRHSFDALPDELRDRDGEANGVEEARRAIAAQALAHPERLALPVFAPIRSRPLRVAMFGTGRQARRLARGLIEVRGLSLDAVASPYAPADSGPDFGHCPSWTSAAEALAGMRPDAVVVAAATHAHFELAKLCVEAGVPVLVEKPFTRTMEEGERLAALAREKQVVVMPAHQVLFTEGLEPIFAVAGPRRLSYARQLPASSPDAPRSWHPSSTYQTLYHALVVVHRAMGGGAARVVEAQVAGVSVPERLRLALTFESGDAELSFDFASSGESLHITSAPSSGPELVWRRAGREASLVVGGEQVAIERRGNDVERMLAAFQAAVLGQARPTTTPEDALEIMAATDACLDALVAAGAPFERPNAPRHVASRAIAEPVRARR